MHIAKKAPRQSILDARHTERVLIRQGGYWPSLPWVGLVFVLDSRHHTSHVYLRGGAMFTPNNRRQEVD